jgi:hypothetical protein
LGRRWRSGLAEFDAQAFVALPDSIYFALLQPTEGTMHKKHSLPTCAGIALVLIFGTNVSARADYMWGYNWAPSATQVDANAGGPGYLTLTNEPSNTATGSSNTVVTNIQAFSTAPYTNPATFNNVPISFALQLTDSASNTSSSPITFSGDFSGYITANSANVQLAFTSPTSETVTLGGNQYAVVVGTYTPPGPPGTSNSGSLNAFVTVTPVSGGGGISSVPEPGALTLACLAFPLAGLCGWRRRKTN